MKFTLNTTSFTEVTSEALVVLVNTSKIDEDVSLKNHKQLTAVNNASNNCFSNTKHLPKKSGEIRAFYNLHGINAASVLVVATDDSLKSLTNAVLLLGKHVKEHDVKSVSLIFDGDEFESMGNQVIARIITQEFMQANYQFTQCKPESEKFKTSLEFLVESNDANVAKGIEQGNAIALGMKLTRDLGNLPANICTPKYLAKKAKKLGEKYDSLDVTILKKNEIEELGMNSLLSVSKGSIQPPRLISMHHKGSDDDPIIFVGKGVTFDSGGISLKPGARMDEMKYDMLGGGSVFGLIKAISELNLPINVMGIVPSVENMPSDRASKPGDIYTSMSGKTIEVLNTDAEGRLILCDALTYAQQYNPKALIDLATLTGAAIVALGHVASVVMSNDDELAKNLLEAGEKTGDRAWQLPYWQEYTEQLKGPFADLQNLGMEGAGTITAGCFLGEFTKESKWAHIDIAGTAWKNRQNGATGRPVPLLTEFVLSHLK